MENMDIMNYVVNNTSYMIAILGVLMIVMYLLIINLYYNLNYMKKRYKKMMTGVDDGANLERMLLGHIDGYGDKVCQIAVAAKRSSANTDSTKNFCLITDTNLAKFNSGTEHCC